MANWQNEVLKASKVLNLVSDEKINEVLNAVAEETEKHTLDILEANKKDLSLMDNKNPLYDRLMLTEDRIKDIAEGIRSVSRMESPLNKILEQRTLPNGLFLRKISVPFGVVGIIYEARPNVSFDVFSLCFKSGNVCILKGGTDAYNSNFAIVSLIKDVLKKFNLDENIIHLMPAGHKCISELINAVGYVDLIIPRGGSNLIKYVKDNSKVPVIETGAGVVNTYFDEYGDVEKGAAIVNNAKTRRVSVCNALDCLIINEKRLKDLPKICEKLAESNVMLELDSMSIKVLKGKYPDNLIVKATDRSYGTEFMDYRMSIKTVGSLDEAIDHISKYGTKHSECIITEDKERAEIFQKQVDAACVYVNAPTSFTDGGQFGMGAEIGISTQKLHARGPMALPEITTYKWLINGNGQIRNK